MSAYIVSDKTIDAIIYGARVYAKNSPCFKRFSPWADADVIGQALVNQNYASVNYRYEEKGEPHEYRFQDEDDWRVSAILIDKSKTYTLGEVYGAIRCYSYQACETPDWDKSGICRWLQSMESEICRIALERLGEDVPWGIN